MFSTAGEVKRQAVNAWVRTSGEYDGVIDFDRVLRDPNFRVSLLPSMIVEITGIRPMPVIRRWRTPST